MLKPDFQRKAPVYWEECLDSTSSELKLMADKGTENGTVLTAETQLGGRGRQGRSFISPEGGIYMSMLIRPNCEAERCTQLTPLAAVAVYRAVKEYTGLDADIKWPNDLLLGGKKFCGILTELSFDKDGKAQVILGIGINLNTPKEAFEGELSDIACSVLSHCGKSFDKAKLLELLIKELDEHILRWQNEGCFFLEEYRQHCICKNRDGILLISSKAEKVKLHGIADDLSLVVCREDGREENIYSGEISLRI